MTQEHLTDQQVEAYRDRTLDANAGSALASHLAACDPCLRRVIDTAHVDVAYSSLKESLILRPEEEPFHLSREELKRYAQGQADQADRTIFESHLDDCLDCSRLAEDLSLVAPAVATGEAIGEPRPATTSLWPRFLGSWRRSPSLRPVYLGGIALVIVSATLLILSIRSRYSSGGAQVSAPQAASSDTRDQNQPGTTPPGAQPGAQPGDEIVSDTPERPKEIVVSLVDGSLEVTLDKQGKLSGLDGMSKPIQSAVQHALSTKEIEKPRVLDQLESQRIILLGEPSDSTPIALLAPIGVVSLYDRPTFRWQPLTGATNYRISIYDSNFNRVVQSSPQATNTWRAPAPLKRGSTYFWEISGLKDGQEITSPVAPAPRAQFRIVDAKTAGEINQVSRTRPDSRLVLGILYARAGLLDDAEREFQLLVNANPSSEVAGRLLSRVRSWKKQ